MASLMENMIRVLEEETEGYQELLEISKRKTPIIVKGDLEQLQKITDEEQIIVSRLNNLEKKREETLNDIATVINKDVKTLKLTNLIQVLEGRPKEQQQLAKCHDGLKEAVRSVVQINEQNKLLLENALELVEFDINVLHAMNAAPETANYTRNAYSDGTTIGANVSGFDAKQ